jgi:hypothetical protein
VGKQGAGSLVNKHEPSRHTLTSKSRYVFPYDLYLVVLQG